MKKLAARIRICGVPVDIVDKRSALEIVDGFVTSAERAVSVIAVNPEKVIEARRSSALLAQLSAAGLLLPDGIGMVWAARLLGLGRMVRVPGAEMMPEICELAAFKGYRVFLYGGAKDVNEDACRNLIGRYPGLIIAGSSDGYVKDDAMVDLVEQINRSRAQILFLALGSPRQELWIKRFSADLATVRVCQGVGGTFDVIAGKVERAPYFWRKMNLEWCYRLMKNPSRLRRQTALPRFVVLVVKRILGIDKDDCYLERNQNNF